MTCPLGIILCTIPASPIDALKTWICVWGAPNWVTLPRFKVKVAGRGRIHNGILEIRVAGPRGKQRWFNWFSRVCGHHSHLAFGPFKLAPSFLDDNGLGYLSS